MLLVVTESNAGMIYSDNVPRGLCMAVSHGGDGFWYYAPVTKDGNRYTAQLDKKFCGYAWADKNARQPTQRQMYLLLAGETVELEP
jgi:hypothetical protein